MQLCLQVPAGLQISHHVAPVVRVKENRKIASVIPSVISLKTAAGMPLKYVLQLVRKKL